MGMLVAFVVALGLLACDDEPADTVTPPSVTEEPTGTAPPTATPEPSPTVTPVTVANAAGPLFYYVAGPPHEPVLRAVDLATGTEVLSQPLGRFTDATMRGERLLIQLDGAERDEVMQMGLDGMTIRTIHGGDFEIGAFEISPDRTMLVVVEHATRALILDWQSLEVIAELRQEELPFSPGDGVLSWAQWVEDSQHIILDIGIERDGCGPGHVTLSLDGSWNFVEEDDCNNTAPNGRLMADPTGYGCFVIGGDTVRVLDAFTGEEVSRYVEERTGLTPWSWSSDSTELLVRRSYVREGIDPLERCRLDGPHIDIYESFDWLTIDAATGVTTKVEDFDALFERWFPEHRVTLSCGTPLPQVLWSRFGRMRARCDSEAAMGTVSVDGVVVGEATEIEVLGFVEQ